MSWFTRIFRNTSGPTRINEAQINNSVQGYPVPVGWGCFKAQQSLIWLDGFGSTHITGNTGGNKGLGGGKGDEYDYSANVIAALCDDSKGNVQAIRDVWSGSTWLGGGQTSEPYTVSGGTPIYTPVYGGGRYVADHGVSIARTVSVTYNDLGAPTPTVLSASVAAPLAQQPYGATLTTGQYSVDPATGDYYFSTADVGVTVIISYSYTLKTNQQQIRAIVPISQQIALGTNLTVGEGSFQADKGVAYYNTGGTNGDALTFDSGGGTPGTTGHYAVSGSLPAVYKFAAADVGQEVLITYTIDVSQNVLTGTPENLNFLLLQGGLLKSPWSLLTSRFPYARLGYSGKGLVCYGPMDMGEGGNVQQNQFEVLTADGWGGGIIDTNPILCIYDIATNPVWGLGSGPVPFPLSAIDNGTSGTWGKPSASGWGKINFPVPRGGGLVVTSGTASDWFAANNFFISPYLDHQDSGSSVIGRWLEAGQVAAFMSEGLWKLVPYGDTSATGNGSTWTAPRTYAFNLTDDNFISDPGKDPVKTSCTPWMDAVNKVQISWTNRANQYAPELTQEWDQASINRYGERLEDPQTYDFITTLAAAAFAGSMRVKRSVYQRNTYTWKLNFQWEHLECMDVGTITTASQWAGATLNQNLNITQRPVRITKITDKPDGTREITAEDYPFGANQPTIFPKGTGVPQLTISQMNDPGDTEAVFFEATDRLTAYAGRQIWFGVYGVNDDWGGCNILASMDGTNYKPVATIKTTARLGTLAASLANTADPDTTDTLVVNLATASAPLDAGTTADADQDNTLCYVDGELLSYSACAVSGPDQYTLTSYIRRGQMGTAPAAHASGAAFLRLDDAIFKYTYDPSWAGKTIYLKFQSFNTFNSTAQDPSTLTPVTFTVPGVSLGAIDGATGAAVNLGGVDAATVIQGLVNSGGLPAGSYGGITYGQLTLSPPAVSGSPVSTTFQAYLAGVATSAVTWSLGSGSLGSVSGGTWTPPGTVPPHGGAAVIATSTANPSVQATAVISW